MVRVDRPLRDWALRPCGFRHRHNRHGGHPALRTRRDFQKLFLRHVQREAERQIRLRQGRNRRQKLELNKRALRTQAAPRQTGSKPRPARYPELRQSHRSGKIPHPRAQAECAVRWAMPCACRPAREKQPDCRALYTRRLPRNPDIKTNLPAGRFAMFPGNPAAGKNR